MSNHFLKILGISLILLSSSVHAATNIENSDPWTLHIINDTGHTIKIHVNNFDCVHPDVVSKLTDKTLHAGDGITIREPWIDSCPILDKHYLQVCADQTRENTQEECHSAAKDDLESKYMRFSK